MVQRNLKILDLEGSHWYDVAHSRAEWRLVCKEALDDVLQQQQQQVRILPERQIQCHLCRRLFRREADLARHKCVEEHNLPVCQQRGAVQCLTCNRWFRSKGGLAVHRCAPLQPPRDSQSSSAIGRSRSTQAAASVVSRGSRPTRQVTIPERETSSASSVPGGSADQATWPGTSALQKGVSQHRNKGAQHNAPDANNGSLAMVV